MSNQQLEALLAREAIRELPVRYCDFVWRNDIEGIVGLFAADGEFRAIFGGKEASAKGSEALREFFTGGLSIQPRPYIHNHVVDLHSADSAGGRCYLDLHSAARNMEWIGAGFYEDDYVRVDGAWKFRSRRFTALRMDDLPDGLAED